jgi:hypothetical protein
MKLTRRTLIPAVCLILCLPYCAWAADSARLEKKITLNLKEASVKDLFRVYEDLLGVKLDFACAEDKKITFAFENITVKTSLDALCESAGLQWRILEGDPPTLRIDCGSGSTASPLAPVAEPKPGGAALEQAGKIKVYEPEGAKGEHPPYKIDVFLEDADLEKVLGMIAKLMNAKPLVDHSIGGRKISINLKRASLEEVLDAACRQAKAQWHLREGEERLLIVDPAR